MCHHTSLCPPRPRSNSGLKSGTLASYECEVQRFNHLYRTPNVATKLCSSPPPINRIIIPIYCIGDGKCVSNRKHVTQMPEFWSNDLKKARVSFATPNLAKHTCIWLICEPRLAVGDLPFSLGTLQGRGSLPCRYQQGTSKSGDLKGGGPAI